MAAARPRLLTPFQGALIHLVLIGLPLRFGLTCLFGKWFQIASLCSLYEQYSGGSTTCHALEEFLLQDYGHRFLVWYTLALFAALTIRCTGGDSSNLGLRRLNRALIVVTFLNVLGMAYLQHFGNARFTSDYFSLVVLNSLLAIATSVYVCRPTTIPTSKKPAKWTLPGTALFGGLVSIVMLPIVAVVNFSSHDLSDSSTISTQSVTCVIVVASVQTLMSEEGIGQYLDSIFKDQVTSVVTSAFTLSTLQSLLSVILLKSLRDSMTLRQLCIVCLFKLIYSLILPLVWLPEESSFVFRLNTKIILSARIVLILLYLIAYLFAGKANKVGRILSSEKDA